MCLWKYGRGLGRAGKGDVVDSVVDPVLVLVVKRVPRNRTSTGQSAVFEMVKLPRKGA